MFPCMKRRHLEAIVQDIEVFEKPKILLEQYVTPPFLAATMLHTIQVISFSAFFTMNFS